MINYNISNFHFHLPWFIFDKDNLQLITTPTIPSDISDNKDIILAETPIPGLNYKPISYGGGDNRKISFTIPLIKRNNTVGNVLMLKQFDNLRNQAPGLLNIFTGQFTPNPKVIFYWGIGSVPLEYYVKQCNATHKQGWINNLGYPQYSEIQIELWLDENSTLYKAEEVFRKFASISGMAFGIYDAIQDQNNKKVF